MTPQEQLNFIGNQLKILTHQSENTQKILMNVQRLVATKSGNGGASRVVYQPVIVGVKDISSAQLFDAYQRGLNIDQLCQLADGKFTHEQIKKKLMKQGGIML